MPENKPQIHTFSNGLRLVYESHPAKIPQTHIRAFCHVGSIHEPENIRGVSHFIEHLCFKGSRAFPSWHAVIDPFSQDGTNFNATTTKQFTCFIVDCLDNQSHAFLRILGDMMLRSKFVRSEYKLESNVMREEMKMRKPKSFIEKLAFSGSAYANWVDHDSYHKPGCLRYEDVVNFYHQYYVPQNIVISVVSSLSFNCIIKHVESTSFVDHLPRLQKILPIVNSTLGALDSNCESTYMLHSTKEGDTTRIEIGVRVCDQFKTDEYHVLNTLRHIVSLSMSSRLFIELREKRGLTYRSGSYMTLYETAGIFVIYAISDATRLIKDGKSMGVIPVMFDILDDLIKNGIKDAELKRAKNSIKNSFKMHAVAGGEKSAYNGVRVMLHNDDSIMATNEVYDKCYKKITKTHVNDIIAKYFASRRYYFSVIGGNLPKSETLVTFL